LLLVTASEKHFVFDGTGWQASDEPILYRYRDKELPHFMNDASFLKYPINRNLMYLRNKSSNEICLL
jgi:hypothetical protein